MSHYALIFAGLLQPRYDRLSKYSFALRSASSRLHP